MKIVIDARMYGLEHAGIGRYLVNLIGKIEEISEENEFIILLRKKYFHDLRFSRGAGSGSARNNKRFKKILADYPHYSFQEQILLPLQLIKLKPDLVHFPHFNVPLLWWGKYVVTIHDLIKHESRGMATTTRAPLVYWLKQWLYLLIVKSAVKRAVKIITPSRFWQEELVKRYGLPKNKIVVTYEGVDENIKFEAQSSKSERIMEGYKIKKPFVVYTGSLYPHKNVERLVMALKRLNDLNHLNISLVVVCARNIFYERFKKKIRQMKAEKFVNLVGFVPDEDLAAVYKEAEAFVFPSFWEGFGLPGLEAMSLGLPVISSNASCLPEIYGEAALYFDPLKVGEIVEKIKFLRSDRQLREKLIKAGFAQVKKYSWEKMARETLKVYESSLSLRSS